MSPAPTFYVMRNLPLWECIAENRALFLDKPSWMERNPLTGLPFVFSQKGNGGKRQIGNRESKNQFQLGYCCGTTGDTDSPLSQSMPVLAEAGQGYAAMPKISM